jgi:hypothetical protein
VASRVVHADLLSFLIPWLTAELAKRPEAVCRDVSVRNVEPSGTTLPRRMVVIRDDSGPTLSLVTAERTVGISVLAGTKETPKEAMDLALIVNALLSDAARVEPGNPVAAVESITGPFAVDEALPKARRYSTVTFIVAGSPF